MIEPEARAMSTLYRYPRDRAKPCGFTLIELLIVIAIILILIAIALPNFLEAQIRSRVTSTKANLRSFETAMYAFHTDYGDLYPDYNDLGALPQLVIRLRAKTPAGCNSPERVCSCFSPPFPANVGLVDFVASREDFYGPGVHCPLTSPIRYMQAGETADPFGNGLIPHGYDSFPERSRVSGGLTGHLAYGAVFGMGPDKIAGDWLRESDYTVDADGDGLREGLPYNPTNGTSSHGDLWRVIPLDSVTANEHYSHRLVN
jgi:prepilin-type N-terminal cleavage/methylation domain-containing protein